MLSHISLAALLITNEDADLCIRICRRNSLTSATVSEILPLVPSTEAIALRGFVRGGWELTNWPVMGELASATSDPAK